jgi:hypothetical protein
MTSLATRTLSACTAFALAVAPVAATAKSASNLNDLVGAKAAGAESDMQSRGWVLTDGHKGSNAAYTYWWNSSRKDCVMVTTRDGRYAAISDVTPGDCNQKSGGSNTGAAVGAVAAGALIAALIASSSHKSGNHDDGQHYSDSQKEADYERGYRDGLHNSPYRASGDRDSYSSGYNNGVEQRDRELAESRNDSGYNSGYRNGGSNSGNTGYNSGYRNGGGSAEPAQFNDLVGAKAAGVESDLQSRGFRNVDGFDAGNGKGTIWWNGRTQQCLQMITVDGRADSISDIQTHDACR